MSGSISQESVSNTQEPELWQLEVWKLNWDSCWYLMKYYSAAGKEPAYALPTKMSWRSLELARKWIPTNFVQVLVTTAPSNDREAVECWCHPDHLEGKTPISD